MTQIYCEVEDCTYWQEDEPKGSCGSDEIEVGDDRRCYSFQSQAEADADWEAFQRKMAEGQGVKGDAGAD